MAANLGGYAIVFVAAFLILALTLLGLLIYRQIQRLRRSSVGKSELNAAVAVGLPRKERLAILNNIDAVGSFRKLCFARFSDCTLDSPQHADKSHIHRMLAFDEIIAGLDGRLESLNPELSRLTGERTQCYLKRVKGLVLPELDDESITRLAFLHDWCRYITEARFGEEQLSEVRHHLAHFENLFNTHQEKLTSLKIPPVTSRFYVSTSGGWDTATPVTSTTQDLSNVTGHARTHGSTDKFSAISEHAPLLPHS